MDDGVGPHRVADERGAGSVLENDPAWLHTFLDEVEEVAAVARVEEAEDVLARSYRPGDGQSGARLIAECPRPQQDGQHDDVVGVEVRDQNQVQGGDVHPDAGEEGVNGRPAVNQYAIVDQVGGVAATAAEGVTAADNRQPGAAGHNAGDGVSHSEAPSPAAWPAWRAGPPARSPSRAGAATG